MQTGQLELIAMDPTLSPAVLCTFAMLATDLTNLWPELEEC